MATRCAQDLANVAQIPSAIFAKVFASYIDGVSLDFTGRADVHLCARFLLEAEYVPRDTFLHPRVRALLEASPSFFSEVYHLMSDELLEEFLCDICERKNFAIMPYLTRDLLAREDLALALCQRRPKILNYLSGEIRRAAAINCLKNDYRKFNQIPKDLREDPEIRACAQRMNCGCRAGAARHSVRCPAGRPLVY